MNLVIGISLNSIPKIVAQTMHQQYQSIDKKNIKEFISSLTFDSKNEYIYNI